MQCDSVHFAFDKARKTAERTKVALLPPMAAWDGIEKNIIQIVKAMVPGIPSQKSRAPTRRFDNQPSRIEIKRIMIPMMSKTVQIMDTVEAFVW